MTPDPRSVMLTTDDVARRLQISRDLVKRARLACDPNARPKPMPGWVQMGTSENRPDWRISEADLIKWIEEL